jgi:hypothetical protein
VHGTAPTQRQQNGNWRRWAAHRCVAGPASTSCSTGGSPSNGTRGSSRSCCIVRACRYTFGSRPHSRCSSSFEPTCGDMAAGGLAPPRTACPPPATTIDAPQFMKLPRKAKVHSVCIWTAMADCCQVEASISPCRNADVALVASQAQEVQGCSSSLHYAFIRRSLAGTLVQCVAAGRYPLQWHLGGHPRAWRRVWQTTAWFAARPSNESSWLPRGEHHSRSTVSASCAAAAAAGCRDHGAAEVAAMTRRRALAPAAPRPPSAEEARPLHAWHAGRAQAW